MVEKIKKWWKNEQKNSKFLLAFSVFLVVFSIILGSFLSVSFAASLPDEMTTSIGELESGGFAISLFPSLTGEDAISLSAPFLATGNGEIFQMYCLEREKEWDTDATIKKGDKLDAGYAYLIMNGYPNKSLTGNNDEDFYLTQVAIWLYQDRSLGISDTETGTFNAIQKAAITSSPYYKYIKPLVDGAMQAKDEEADPGFHISLQDFELDSTGTYLETSYLTVSSNVSFSTYQIAVDMDGAQVVNDQGMVVTGKINKDDKIKIRIPLTKVSADDLDVTVTAIFDYQSYEAYEYLPVTHPEMQISVATSVTAVSRQSSAETTVRIPTGSIRVEKVSSVDQQLLAGAKIEVRRDADQSIVATFDSKTTATTISNLLPGKYTVTEKSAPEGYLLQSEGVSVILDTSNLNPTVRLENTPVEVRIRKVDKDTKQALSGAVIHILDSDGTKVFEFTSTNGYTTIPDLGVGKYQAVEVKAPDGYYLNTEPVDFEITEENPAASITMEDVKNEVEIIKIDEASKEALAGAVLRVVSVDTGKTIDEWTTTTSAHLLTGLASGDYQVIEVKPPAGYASNPNVIPFTVSAEQNKKQEISFSNTKSQIMISKVDEEGKLLAGAKLAIYDSTGKLVQQFTSKSTPTVIEKLDVGRYTLREVEAPDGYQLNTTPVSFEVTSDTENLQVTMKNIKNQISFAKVDADTGKNLSGAKLRLVDSNDEVVDEWVSSNEVHSISGLENGTYYFEEVEAPLGYLRNKNRQKVVVNEDSTTHTYTMKNQKIAVRVAKVDKDTGKLVSGATLELLDSNYDVISTWTTTDSYQIFSDLSEGIYYVREKEAPSGYIKNDELEKITLSEENPSVTVDFANEKTTVKIGKVDATTGNYIAGATLRLSRQDGGIEPITFVSEEKATVFRGLTSGIYVLEEIEAPVGYITSHSKVTFEVDSFGKTKNISLKSDYISITVQDKKLHIDTNGVSGYQFQLLTSDGTLVDTYSISKEVFVSDVLDNGNYLLKQVKVPEGVLLNSNSYSFTISDTESSDVVYFANDYTKIDIEKMEMIGGRQLEGAHFILRNDSGEVIEEWDSKDTAKRIEKLVPGVYTLNEVKAPEGYVRNDSLLTFEVKEVGDVQTFRMYDALEVQVPNTSKNSLLYWFLGTIVLMTGLSIFGYVYFKRRGEL